MDGYLQLFYCVMFLYYMACVDAFHIATGLKQGQRMSPLLFVTFKTDIEKNVNSLTDKDLDLSCMYLILFADSYNIHNIPTYIWNPVNVAEQLTATHAYQTVTFWNEELIDCDPGRNLWLISNLTTGGYLSVKKNLKMLMLSKTYSLIVICISPK